MAKMNQPDFEKWYSIARRWIEAALIKGDSLMTPGKPVWTLQHLDDLHRRYVEQFDDGEGDFYSKLQKQLESAESNTTQLMAEVLFGYYLPMKGNLKLATKVNAVQSVLEWVKPPVALADDLKRALSIGIARESQNYIQQRYYQLKLIIELVRDWWKLDETERATLIADPWAFKDFTAKIPAHNNNAARQMILFFAHTESFEPIMADSDKQAIASLLANDAEKNIADHDRRLFAIRERLTPQRSPGFSFYEGDLKSIWKPDAEDVSDTDEVDVPPHNDDTGTLPQRYWKIAPGEKARLWEMCREKGIICIGWNAFGDLRNLDRPAFDDILIKLMEKHGFKKGCRVVWTFAKKIKKGDIIIANRGTTQVLGIGKVTGDYYFDAEADYAHCLPVDWYDTSPKSVNFGHWVGTLIKVSPEDFQLILKSDPAQGKQPDQTTRTISKVAEFTAGTQPSHTHFPLLIERKNLLLHGPPGTGKTFTTLEIADQWGTWQGTGTVSQVTFHPSYAYEDFIEGFRPDANGQFTLQPGLFFRVCDAARKSPSQKFLLIIDELNRGDVARIFGELITLIERDKRNKRASRRLPYSRNNFYVPDNLFLLGTMNTADRSISLLDIAIRRRFCFVECPPSAEAIVSSADHYQVIEGISLSQLMLSINARLQQIGVERDRSIGHSYFLIRRDGPPALAELRSRIRHDIVPLIEEYCYANRSQVATVLGTIMRDGVIANDRIDDDASFVQCLSTLCEAD